MDDAEEIKERLNDALERVIGHFWPGAKTVGKIAYCAPGAKADLGSFQVYVGNAGKYQRGSWVRSSAGIGGDELNLFAYGHTGGGSHRATAEIFDAAREFVGLDRSKPETPAQQEQRKKDQVAYAKKREADQRVALARQQVRTRDAGAIWMDCTAIEGTLAEAYLLARGIPVPPGGWSNVMRFHPGLVYDLDESLVLPCLVCRVDDVFGELIAIWRIYLNPLKPDKANVANAKLGYGPAAGGAIRLGGVANHIGLCEGLETAHGAAALIKHRYPVWAGMSTAVSGFEPPLEVERITGYPDGDKPWKKHGDDIVITEPAGRGAMRRLGERMAAIDMRFDLQPEPKIRQDYLNIWNARQRMEALA